MPANVGLGVWKQEDQELKVIFSNRESPRPAWIQEMSLKNNQQQGHTYTQAPPPHTQREIVKKRGGVKERQMS